MNKKQPLHQVNAQLNKIEYALGRSYMESMPRHMTIVLGNSCNINCLHCYQEKNGDNLLKNKAIGSTLRREFLQIYPYLETLRVQGGEIFALRGFKELLHDIACTINRPLISTSTNGTLLNESWCRHIVEAPFQTVTFSLDAGTKTTYEKLRRGANFEKVISNIKRLQEFRTTNNSWYPNIDSFYVVMRSNFREIPQFMELMLSLKIYEISFQTLLVDDRNIQREPKLIEEKLISPEEIKELYTILKTALEQYRCEFDVISFSGLKSLFEHVGLDTEFLNEEHNSLHPGQNKLRNKKLEFSHTVENTSKEPIPENDIIEKQMHSGQCPNPWTTFFVTENGDVSLCFLSEPVGNLYKTPLTEIWNNRQAVSKRSRILAGYYTESGCSNLWCDWRDGQKTSPPNNKDWHCLLNSFRTLICILSSNVDAPAHPSVDRDLSAVRRIMKYQENRIVELESNLQLLWADNIHIFRAMESQIHELKNKLEGTDKLKAHLTDIMWLRRIIRRIRILSEKYR